MFCLLAIPAFLVVFFSTASPCCAMPIDEPLTMPANCLGKYLCHERHENYPKAVIEELLADIGYLPQIDMSVEGRIGNEGDDECQSTVKMLPFYEIIDEEGKFRFVVQSDKFNQVLRTEECMKPGKITEATHNLPLTIVESNNLTCMQRTLNFEFLVLSHDAKSLETVKAKGGVPVCCSCRRLQ